MNGRVADQRQDGGLGEGLSQRETQGRRIGPGPVDHVVDQQDRDVVQQQGGHDLVGAEEGAQRTGDQTPQPPTDQPAHDHGAKQKRSWPVGSGVGDRGGAEGAEVELSLGPDVPQQHAKGDRHRKRSEYEGDGGEDGLRLPVGGAERPRPHRAVDRPGSPPGRLQEDSRNGETHRAGRSGEPPRECAGTAAAS